MTQFWKPNYEIQKGVLETQIQQNADQTLEETRIETEGATGDKSEAPLLKQSGVHWPRTPLTNCTALDAIGLLKVRQNTSNTKKS